MKAIDFLVRGFKGYFIKWEDDTNLVIRIKGTVENTVVYKALYNCS